MVASADRDECRDDGSPLPSRQLFDHLNDGAYMFPGALGGDRRTLLVSALKQDLANVRTLPDADDLVAEASGMLSEVAGLSDATCRTLHSVVELAQNDRTLPDDPRRAADRWYVYLRGQDVDAYRAPRILRHERSARSGEWTPRARPSR